MFVHVFPFSAQVDVSRVADRLRDSPFPVIKMDVALEKVLAAVKPCPLEELPAAGNSSRPVFFFMFDSFGLWTFRL